MKAKELDLKMKKALSRSPTWVNPNYENYRDRKKEQLERVNETLKKLKRDRFSKQRATE